MAPTMPKQKVQKSKSQTTPNVSKKKVQKSKSQTTPTVPKKKVQKPKSQTNATVPKKKGKKSQIRKPQKIEISDEDRLPGVVYIGHIPHGFYERQINEYFSQFGKVLELKLSRSKKTGNSKGYAFVKFQYAAVAKTVAETCNNYLFFNRLLKCVYKPLSDIHPDTFFRYHMTPNRRPKRLHNCPQDEEKVVSSFNNMVGKQKKKMNKLQNLGIDLDLEDVVEINKSRLPDATKTTDETSEKETETAETPKSPRGTVRKSSKRKAEAIEEDKPSTASETVTPLKSQSKSPQPGARKSSKRKAEAIEEDKHSTATETKISPAAKRLKRAVKNSSSPQQTKSVASKK